MSASLRQAKKATPALTFGPYANAAEATVCIQRFINAGFSADTAKGLGIIWAEPAGAAVLRPPVVDQQDQLGASLMVQWHGPVPPKDPKLPEGTMWQSIEDAVRGVYETIGAGVHAASRSLDRTQQMMQQSFGDNPTPDQMDAESGVYALMGIREAWRWVEKELAAHPLLAASVATVMDGIGIVAGAFGVVALFPAAATVGGFVAITGAITATVASAALIWADGKDAYLVYEADRAAAEKTGAAQANEAKEAWEHSDYFRRTELIAPLLALPDATRGGIGLAKEIGEASGGISDARAGIAQANAKIDQVTAKVADQQAANAAKAKIYKGDKQKLQKLVAQQKNAVKQLAKAHKKLEDKKDELWDTLKKARWPDIPGLAAVSVGTSIYVGNTPDLVEKSTQAAEKRAEAGKTHPPAPVDHLVPGSAAHMPGNMPHYLSCSMVVSSPLQNPGQK